MNRIPSRVDEMESKVHQMSNVLRVICAIDILLACVNIFWLDNNLVTLIIVLFSVYIIYSNIKLYKLANKLTSLDE